MFQALLDVVVFQDSLLVSVFQFPPAVSMVTVLSPLSLFHERVVDFSGDSDQLSFVEDHEVAFASGRAAIARSPASLVRPTMAFKWVQQRLCKLKSICTTRMQRRIECADNGLD